MYIQNFNIAVKLIVHRILKFTNFHTILLQLQTEYPDELQTLFICGATYWAQTYHKHVCELNNSHNDMIRQLINNLSNDQLIDFLKVCLEKYTNFKGTFNIYYFLMDQNRTQFNIHADPESQFSRLCRGITLRTISHFLNNKDVQSLNLLNMEFCKKIADGCNFSTFSTSKIYSFSKDQYQMNIKSFKNYEFCSTLQLQPWPRKLNSFFDHLPIFCNIQKLNIDCNFKDDFYKEYIFEILKQNSSKINYLTIYSDFSGAYKIFNTYLFSSLTELVLKDCYFDNYNTINNITICQNFLHIKKLTIIRSKITNHMWTLILTNKNLRTLKLQNVTVFNKLLPVKQLFDCAFLDRLKILNIKTHQDIFLLDKNKLSGLTTLEIGIDGILQLPIHKFLHFINLKSPHLKKITIYHAQSDYFTFEWIKYFKVHKFSKLQTLSFNNKFIKHMNIKDWCNIIINMENKLLHLLNGNIFYIHTGCSKFNFDKMIIQVIRRILKLTNYEITICFRINSNIRFLQSSLLHFMHNIMNKVYYQHDSMPKFTLQTKFNKWINNITTPKTTLYTCAFSQLHWYLWNFDIIKLENTDHTILELHISTKI